MGGGRARSDRCWRNDFLPKHCVVRRFVFLFYSVCDLLAKHCVVRCFVVVSLSKRYYEPRDSFLTFDRSSCIQPGMCRGIPLNLFAGLLMSQTPGTPRYRVGHLPSRDFVKRAGISCASPLSCC